MTPSRRRFLKYALGGSALAAAGTSWWATTSNQRSARLLRTLVSDLRRSVAPAPVRPEPAKWSDNRVTICWLGHASVLINFYGVRILTDPAFGERIGLCAGPLTAGPKRYVAAALRPSELPPIDVLLLSHAHMDHMDLASLGRMPKRTQTISARLTSDVLGSAGLTQLKELGWNERTLIRCAQGDLEIRALQVKHWGRRWPRGMDRGYNGYVLRREGKAILFGGDTAHTPLFSEHRAHGPFEAAIMPIGAYQPWIWNHCSPEQALELANMAGARYLVPVHHQTFKLSDEPMHEPIERLETAMQAEPERLALRRIGETFVVPV